MRRWASLLFLNLRHLLEQQIGHFLGLRCLGIGLERIRLPEKLYRYKVFQKNTFPTVSPLAKDYEGFVSSSLANSLSILDRINAFSSIWRLTASFLT